MALYGIFVFGKLWSEHGTPVMNDLTGKEKAITLAQSMLKNDERITAIEVWEFEGVSGAGNPRKIYMQEGT